MKKRVKTEALADLAASMDKNKPIDKTENKQKRIKPKSREVSNVPWYPKSFELKKELKLLAIHENSSLTALIDEGIKLLLEKRGKDINDYI